jgi:hypothetical protein
MNGAFSPHDMAPWFSGWGFSVGWLILIIMAAFWIPAVLAIVFLIRGLLYHRNSYVCDSDEIMVDGVACRIITLKVLY